MADPATSRLGLPLMQAAQAQKHVTLNEALMRLDGLVSLTLQEVDRVTPPATVLDGACYGVGAGAVNAWAGQQGSIAIGSGGGWIFVQPSAGMRARDLARGRDLLHNGTTWVAGALTLSPGGAGMVAGIAEADCTLSAGTSVTAPLSIPGGVLVIGVTARVKDAITGTLTGWQLGTAGALDRFGLGLGLGAGAWARGLLGTPMTYWNAEPLVLTATGGAFAGGRVRLAAHWWELRLPD